MSFDRELLSSVLPAYDIGDELGAGGWGVVVSGQHRQLDRRVAIKQLPAALAADPGVRRRWNAAKPSHRRGRHHPPASGGAVASLR